MNVVTAPTGGVRVALVGERNQTIAGYGFEDCEPISGDHRRAVARWKGEVRLPANQPIKARVEITRGTLWAFEFAA